MLLRSLPGLASANPRWSTIGSEGWPANIIVAELIFGWSFYRQGTSGGTSSVLRMLGLFDRPADEKALEALLAPPAIQGLTESLTGLSSTERRTIFAKL